MANQTAQEELLLDVRVAEASSLYKFYLIQEKKILGTAAVILFLTAWELCGNTLQLINPMFMSAPSFVFTAAYQMFASGEIYNDLYVSGIEFVWGYLLSVLVAVPFGIAIGWYKRFAYICDPFVNAMVNTVRPNASATPIRPMPTFGNAAARTALPHPPRTSQNVPRNSALYCFISFISSS